MDESQQARAEAGDDEVVEGRRAYGVKGSVRSFVEGPGRDRKPTVHRRSREHKLQLVKHGVALWRMPWVFFSSSKEPSCLGRLIVGLV